MEVVKGIVQQVSIKERKAGQYGDWASYGIKINDTWYNGALNADKRSGELILKDKDYVEVAVGMEIEFLLVEKNGYKNIDPKTVKALSGGSNSNMAQQPTPQENVHQTLPKTPTADYLDLTICRGMAASMAKMKFTNKPIPENVEDSVERLATTYLNQIKK